MGLVVYYNELFIEEKAKQFQKTIQNQAVEKILLEMKKRNFESYINKYDMLKALRHDHRAR